MTKTEIMELAEYMQPILKDPDTKGSLAIIAIFKDSNYMQRKLANTIYRAKPQTESMLLKTIVPLLKELDQRKLAGLTD
ncbi:MAG: hypothetical protein II937_16955 [Bacteroidales bacterium]|nr:hypothetical protein [Bacteroidales bacterium]